MPPVATTSLWRSTACTQQGHPQASHPARFAHRRDALMIVFLPGLDHLPTVRTKVLVAPILCGHKLPSVAGSPDPQHNRISGFCGEARVATVITSGNAERGLIPPQLVAYIPCPRTLGVT